MCTRRVFLRRPHLGMPDRLSHLLPATPPEVSLLLRAHAEQHWLSREVAPVARQIETGECPDSGELLPAEQLPAALAYLEVIWIEAVRRAGDSDGALTRLDLSLPSPSSSPESMALAARARRYHAAVLALREALSRRVAALLVGSAGWGGCPVEAWAGGSSSSSRR
jgi:hypothetical protein